MKKQHGRGNQQKASPEAATHMGNRVGLTRKHRVGLKSSFTEKSNECLRKFLPEDMLP